MVKKTKKELANARSTGKARKMKAVLGFIASASGVGGFVNGVIRADLNRSTTFEGRDTEGKLMHIIDNFLGRMFSWNPFGVVKVGRKPIRPLGWVNLDTVGAGVTALASFVLRAAPNFKGKGLIKKSLDNAVFPYLLGSGVGQVFDPPANPGGAPEGQAVEVIDGSTHRSGGRTLGRTGRQLMVISSRTL